MGDFLGNIYSWFQSFYSANLNYYLWGYDPATQAYTNAILYGWPIGLVTLLFAVLVFVVFYYIIDHPRTKKWHWVVVWLANGLFAFLFGGGYVMSDLDNGNIPDELVYQFDESGNIVSELITTTDCWGFGAANMCVSLIFFVLLTVLFKWWSKQNRHMPF